MVDWIIDNGTTILLAAFVILGALLFWRKGAMVSKRARKIKEYAAEIGWTHEASSQKLNAFMLESDLVNFAPYSDTEAQPRKITLLNILSATDTMLFDYSSSGFEVDKTILFARVRGVDFPHFLLKPKGLLEKAEKLAGFQKMDCPAGLSADYCLVGESAADVDQLFRPRVLDALSFRTDFCVEVWSDRILITTDERLRLMSTEGSGANRIGLFDFQDYRKFHQDAMRLVNSLAAELED
ncbi:hypothetical protein [Lignipirellula cremea]|uniref:DUF3137 domain-containing protein n=1 Tax=Lignipirellula cremea TaxID=2528010 RepID=A0A518DNE7_9BACT|nr:hypothetical protein [Lignipirellula cremea]QDU93368.1 hypothetical protein Pla8534_11480 [Lignipirellula cremea]